MFSTLGLFKAVACPRKGDCSLANCIFDHQAQIQQADDNQRSEQVEAYESVSTGDLEQPLAKRRRLDHATPASSIVHDKFQNGDAALLQSNTAALDETPARAHKQLGTQPRVPESVPASEPATSTPSRLSVKTVPRPQPTSVTRPVSPPRSNVKKSLPPTAIEKLAPRNLAKVPVPFKSRLSYIELLHKLAKDHNSAMEKRDPADNSLVLQPSELIKLVLDDEEEAASAASADLYKNVMSQRYLRYKNMTIKDWTTLVTERFRSDTSHKADVSESSISTGLAPAEEIELLRGLKTSVMGLEAHGYVTVPPTNAQIQQAKQASVAAQGFEVCDRCGTRFQVFPGRDSQGRLTTQGSCNYHWARIPRTQTAKNARMYGQADSLYPCCNQPAGSEGCTKAESHVFKVADPKRLAALLQFERTPEKRQQRRQPVAFDCEMAYTTQGMELVRLTAIAWPEKKELLDVLVRPYGEILDLNTRFSGVSQEQFANAGTYDVSMASTEQMPNGGTQTRPLQKVESPAVARQLLFDLLTPDTPLIGHAIENDLNACRVVHPFIIDTVLLYPHPAGLPIRYGLKILASKYLHRGIQAAGAQGHDSKEDSVATGDLVRVKVAEKWKSMKLQGWKFEASRLVAPTKPG